MVQARRVIQVSCCAEWSAVHAADLMLLLLRDFSDHHSACKCADIDMAVAGRWLA
jgi:hypothetical protein